MERRFLDDVWEEFPGRCFDNQVSIYSERSWSIIIGKRVLCPLLWKEEGSFYTRLRCVCLSTDSMGHSLVRRDVADPYWRILRHTFFLIHSLDSGGSFNYYEDRRYRLMGMWDTLIGPTFSRMLFLDKEIMAQFYTITVMHVAFVLAKARPWPRTGSDWVLPRPSSVLI